MSEVSVVEEHEVEVLVTITLDEAEEMAAQIRELAAAARDGFEKLALAVEHAKTTNICQVLGYRSWPEFIEAQFGGKIEVHGSARQEVMAFLAGEGMSVRSIAAITDSSKSTVSRVLNEVSQSGTADSGDPTVGGEDQVSHDGTPESEGAQTKPEYTHGRDDKKYRKPKPRKKPEPKPKPEPVAEPESVSTRRVQIPTAFRAEADAVQQHARALHDLTTDPRWGKAFPRIAKADHDWLDDTIATLEGIRVLMCHEPVPAGSENSEAITSALDEESGQSPTDPRPEPGTAEPTPAAEAEEVATTSGPVEPEVLQQDSDAETSKASRPTNCRRCNVDLPASATSPLCDDCDGAPEAPARDTTEPPAVVVHNEAISKRSHQRRRFSDRKVTA
ncbi:helix-turn-helix domain containing protein [Mycobacteroides abscessus]|uniref:helix-turn-helix domain containing protein n=1 Tax=Mycobacteroides abscessus TaxID=36809 RepID=UPI0009272196|nr:helix-turn-helix domain containing protein [Mycobacteroides abscessus]SIM22018.1 Uncharacterised protein [Mycobacteroides abscessus subsp. abscessus]